MVVWSCSSFFDLFALRYIIHPSSVILFNTVGCLPHSCPSTCTYGYRLIWTTGSRIELDNKTWRREKPRYISLAFCLEQYLSPAMDISLNMVPESIMYLPLILCFFLLLLLSALCFIHNFITNSCLTGLCII